MRFVLCVLCYIHYFMCRILRWPSTLRIQVYPSRSLSRHHIEGFTYDPCSRALSLTLFLLL
jgi:hypothetical protein